MAINSEGFDTMSREKITDWDQRIQDAKEVLAKVEAKASRLREAIETFKAEKAAATRKN